MTRLLIYSCSIFLILWSCKEKNRTMAVETDFENQEPSRGDWQVLFDGSSFDSWKGYLKDKVPDTWKIEDGAMVFYPPENREGGESFNIVTREEFTDFVLSLEWKISKGGNSGIFWAVIEDEAYPQPYETGPEIQVLDNTTHPDAMNGTTHQAGALYDMVAPSEDVTKPVGQWNHCELLVNYKANRGMVNLNGVKILEFTPGGTEWEAMVKKSKFADWKGFAISKSGKIGLQDHGDIVAFRNIKIKRL